MVCYVNLTERSIKTNKQKNIRVGVCLIDVKHVGHAVLLVLFDSASDLEIEARVALLTEEDSWDIDHRVWSRKVCFI